MSNSERIQILRDLANEAKKAEEISRMKTGQFNDALTAFLRDNKMPENFTILDLIETFSPRVIA